MKKFVTLITLLSFTVCVYAVPGISFSNGTNGYWDYTASAAGEGAFSFNQPVNVTNVVGGTGDILLGKEVYIPTLNVSNFSELVSGLVYTGDVNPETSLITLMDGSTVILEGNLSSGGVLTIGSVANFYPEVVFNDIEITSLNSAYATSAFIGSLQVGDTLDFALTLQNAGTTNIADMVMGGTSTNPANNNSRSFSGSMAVPEPATMALLALGGLLIRKRKQLK